jgi:hypothetical protein
MTTQILGLNLACCWNIKKQVEQRVLETEPVSETFFLNFFIFQHWVLKKFLNLSGCDCVAPSSETYRNDGIGYFGKETYPMEASRTCFPFQLIQL